MIFVIIVGVIFGYYYLVFVIDMKLFGDGFIKLIKMVIGLIIFCMVVIGIVGMEDMKKVGCVGGKVLLYFEIVLIFVLLFGFVVMYLLCLGVGFNIDLVMFDGKVVVLYVVKVYG